MKRGIKSSTRLSAKGQVVIPKAIREAGGWRPGLELEVEATDDGAILRPKRSGARERSKACWDAPVTAAPHDLWPR